MNYHRRTCPFFVTGLTEADTSIKMGVCLFFPIPNDLNDSKTRDLDQDNFKKIKKQILRFQQSPSADLIIPQQDYLLLLHHLQGQGTSSFFSPH